MSRRPECIILPDGSKFWYSNGERHREDGPALEYLNGSKYWYLNDKYLDPKKSVKDPELKEKYLELICSMVIYLVHNL